MRKVSSLESRIGYWTPVCLPLSFSPVLLLFHCSSPPCCIGSPYFILYWWRMRTPLNMLTISWATSLPSQCCQIAVGYFSSYSAFETQQDGSVLKGACHQVPLPEFGPTSWKESDLLKIVLWLVSVHCHIPSQYIQMLKLVWWFSDTEAGRVDWVPYLFSAGSGHGLISLFCVLLFGAFFVPFPYFIPSEKPWRVLLHPV